MRVGSLLKLRVQVVLMFAACSMLALAETKTAPVKPAPVSELSWLSNPELQFQDVTPEKLRQKATLVDYLGTTLVYSDYRLNRDDLAKGCRGKGLYLLDTASPSATGRPIESPLLNCVVNLKVLDGSIYIQTREDSGDKLLLLGKDLAAKDLTVALTDNFDGEKSHLASARRKLKIDLLRKSGAIGAKRNVPARLILNLRDRRVDVLWLVTDQRNYLCLSDSFSLADGSPLPPEPERVPCKATTQRYATDFVKFPNGDLYIFWQGTRTEMGRIEHIVGERSESIGFEGVVDPLNWKSVKAANFTIHYAGNVVPTPGGFFNFETGNLNFDAPFVYFYELKSATFHRISFLSQGNYDVLWIRERNDGILVAMANSNDQKPKIIFVSPSSKGEPVGDL